MRILTSPWCFHCCVAHPRSWLLSQSNYANCESYYATMKIIPVQLFSWWTFDRCLEDENLTWRPLCLEDLVGCSFACSHRCYPSMCHGYIEDQVNLFWGGRQLISLDYKSSRSPCTLQNCSACPSACTFAGSREKTEKRCWFVDFHNMIWSYWLIMWCSCLLIYVDMI